MGKNLDYGLRRFLQNKGIKTIYHELSLQDRHLKWKGLETEDDRAEANQLGEKAADSLFPTGTNATEEFCLPTTSHEETIDGLTRREVLAYKTGGDIATVLSLQHLTDKLCPVAHCSRCDPWHRHNIKRQTSLQHRNKAWAEKLDLEKNPSFVVCGIGHLYDYETFLDYLRVKEWKVEKYERFSVARGPPNRLHARVKTRMGKNITLNVWPNESISSVKTKLQDTTGIPPEQQRFAFRGKELLEDARTLSEYKIKNAKTIILFGDIVDAWRSGSQVSTIQISVKSLTGMNIILNVLPNESISSVKTKVHNKMDSPPELQRMLLLWDRQVLKDDGTLSDYEIRENSTLYLHVM